MDPRAPNSTEILEKFWMQVAVSRNVFSTNHASFWLLTELNRDSVDRRYEKLCKIWQLKYLSV